MARHTEVRIRQRKPALWLATGTRHRGGWYAVVRSLSGRIAYGTGRTRREAIHDAAWKVAELLGALPDVEGQLTAIAREAD